jgi:hypothetical protein
MAYTRVMGNEMGTSDPYLHAPEGDVAVAERRADDLDPELVGLGRVHDDLLQRERLAGGPANGRCSSPGGGREARWLAMAAKAETKTDAEQTPRSRGLVNNAEKLGDI